MSVKSSLRHAGLFTCLLALLPSLLAAQTPEVTVTPVDPGTAATSAAGDNAARLCWTEHPCFRIGNDLFVAATAALQSHGWGAGANTSNEIGDILLRDIARRRVGVSARFFNRVDLRLEREFGDDVEPWRDRYVNVRA